MNAAVERIPTRAEWAERINACWRDSAASILEAARLIGEAKSLLPHGEFTDMVEQDLKWNPRSAQMLMKIAADPRLANPNHGSLLPASWRTLYELTRLDDETFEARIADGTINPAMERRDVAQMRKRIARSTREELLGHTQRALPTKRYGVILADPEWRFEPWSRLTGMDRAADNQYPTSATEVIASRPVESIAAADAVLFLWATVPMLPHALIVMGAWGFDYVSQLVWVKDRIGTGYWFRNKHEILLVGTRGKIPAPAMGMQWPSVLEAAVGRHSEKPEKAYEIIEAYYPNLPKIELNARKARANWDSWGNEAPIEEPFGPDTGEIVEPEAARGGNPTDTVPTLESAAVPDAEHEATEAESVSHDVSHETDREQIAAATPIERHPDRYPAFPPMPSDDELEIPAFLRRAP